MVKNIIRQRSPNCYQVRAISNFKVFRYWEPFFINYKKGGAAKKDSESDSDTGGSGEGKIRGKSSTDLATTVGGLTLEEQPKAG